MPKTIELYNLLKEKIGEEGSVAIIEAFDEVSERIRSEVVRKDYFERRLTEETGKLRIEIEKVQRNLTEETGKLRIEIEKLRSEFKADNMELRSELKNENENLRVEVERSAKETTKWMFLFWIGQIAAMIVIFRLFIKP
ncbi:MAG: hypothetical protein HQL06_06040 [Nitrospirae bacterium]|nr:hypothetical protein [Nitrospirota bacterium]